MGMTGVRLTTWTLCLLFVVVNTTAAQQQNELLTPAAAALRLSSKLERDSYAYANAIQAIASSYWRRGDYDSALAQIETLEPPKQSEQLYYFAGVAINRGQVELARNALNRALKLVLSAEEDSRDSYYIRDLGLRAIEIGDLELAAKFTNLLNEGSARKAHALVSIAQALAKRGEKGKSLTLLDQAMKQFDSFDDEERRELIGLLSMSVNVLASLGEKDSATRLANQANELLQSAQKPDDVDGSQVALSFARLGEFSRAMSVLESLDDHGKANGLLSMAYVYQETGDETAALSSILRAREILESTSDGDYSLSSSLVTVARGYMRLGRLDEAFDIMRGVHDDYKLHRLANDLAESFAAKGRRQDASATLDFAYSQIRRTVSEKSEDIAASASTSKAIEKSRDLTDLGLKYIELGDLRGAAAAANAIDQPQYKAALLASVAVAYARDGDQSRVKSLLTMAFKLSSESEHYNHDLHRDAALLKIAEAYADAGLKQEAANVVLRFLREMRDRDNDSGTIEALIEIGLMAQTKSIPLNSKIQTMLKQVVKKEEDN